MTNTRISVECILNREKDTVSLVLHDIPMQHLETVLREVSTEAWHTNIVDGIRAQYVAGPGLGIFQSTRSFQTGDQEDS